MKTLVFKVAAVAGLIGAIALGIQFYLQGKKDGEGHRLGEVMRMDLVQRVTIAGTITPLRTTLITAPYNGYVQKLYVSLGDLVKKNAPLVSVAESIFSSGPVFPIRAPFSGVVVHIQKHQGQSVKQADFKEYLLRLDDITKMFVTAQVPEIEILKLAKEQKAKIRISAIPNQTYSGVVREISLAGLTEQEYGRSQVEFSISIEMTDFDEKVKPGMTVIADVISEEKKDVLVLGHEFIHQDDDKYYVITAAGARKPVELGLRNESFGEVKSGLEEGTRVRQVDFLGLVEN